MTTLATGEGGFTLMEITFVAFLLGLMAAVAWPAVRRLARSLNCRTEAAFLQDRLLSARTGAVADGVERRVALSDLSGCFRASAPDALFLPDGTAVPVRIRALSEDAPISEIIVDENGRITVRGPRIAA